jgi:NitT/TauT family transport system substrate-binding protein
MTHNASFSRAGALRASLGACIGGALFAGARTTTLAQAPLVIRIGNGTVEPSSQAFYTYDAGFFKKNGLDAQMQTLRSGGVIMEAIISGQIDVGVTNPVSYGSALLRKIPFTTVAAGMFWDTRYPTAAIIVAPNSTVKTAADLNGLTIGVTSLGSIDQIGIASYMDANGGNLASVKYVEIVPAAIAETVSGGRVAAAILNDPELSNAVAAGKVKKIAGAYDGIGKLFYSTVWVGMKDWVSKNPESTRRFAAAIAEGSEWAENNRPQALAILEKYTKFHEDKSVAHFGRKLDPALLQPMWDAAYKYKLFAAPLRASENCWDGK